MAKYHVNDKGETHPCEATKRGCDFGSPEEHYSTPEEAREAYEQRMNAEEGGGLGSFSKSDDEIASALSAGYTNEFAEFSLDTAALPPGASKDYRAVLAHANSPARIEKMGECVDSLKENGYADMRESWDVPAKPNTISETGGEIIASTGMMNVQKGARIRLEKVTPKGDLPNEFVGVAAYLETYEDSKFIPEYSTLSSTALGHYQSEEDWDRGVATSFSKIESFGGLAPLPEAIREDEDMSDSYHNIHNASYAYHWSMNHQPKPGQPVEVVVPGQGRFVNHSDKFGNPVMRAELADGRRVQIETEEDGQIGDNKKWRTTAYVDGFPSYTSSTPITNEQSKIQFVTELMARMNVSTNAD